MVKYLVIVPDINVDQISCNKLVMQEDLIKNEYLTLQNIINLLVKTRLPSSWAMHRMFMFD